MGMTNPYEAPVAVQADQVAIRPETPWFTRFREILVITGAIAFSRAFLGACIGATVTSPSLGGTQVFRAVFGGALFGFLSAALPAFVIIALCYAAFAWIQSQQTQLIVSGIVSGVVTGFLSVVVVAANWADPMLYFLAGLGALVGLLGGLGGAIVIAQRRRTATVTLASSSE